MRLAFVVAAAAILTAPLLHGQAPNSLTREEVEYASGSLRLRGFLFRPQGAGQHPAVVFLHGGGGASEAAVTTIGETFATRGYLLFFPFRRGLGPSAGQGEAIQDRLAREEQQSSEAMRMRLQDQLVASEQLQDVLGAIAYVRSRSDVDVARIGVFGHSMGGQLAVLVSERPIGVKAIVSAATAAVSWSRGPELRDRLRAAARNAKVPIFFFQAANDVDLMPTEQLAEEMRRSGKPHLRKVYPAWGKTSGDGHQLALQAPEVWATDVFAFLAAHQVK